MAIFENWTYDNCPLCGCWRALAFWSLSLLSTAVILPIYVVMSVILYHEKSASGIWFMAYDVLLQRWILHLNGERDDLITDSVMRDGMPGLPFFSDLPNVGYLLVYYSVWQPFKFFSDFTGYVPDFMKLNASCSWINSMYTTRMAYIDGLLKKKVEKGEVEQVIVIGAGWDFRAVEVAKRSSNVACIEVDIPGMQEAKISACKKFNISYDKVTMIPLKLSTTTDLTELKSRVDMKKKTLIVLEGVSYFLESDVVSGIIKMVAEMPRGSCLVADFAIKKCCGFRIWDWKPGKCFFKLVLRLIDEPVRFCLPFFESAVASLDTYVKHVAGDDVEVLESEEIYCGVMGVIVRS